MKDAKKSYLTLEQWLEQAGYSAGYRLQRLAGGDISQTLHEGLRKRGAMSLCCL